MEPFLRLEYGCDGPAELPVFEVSCSCASGCAHCDGKRVVQLFRCPGKLLEQAGAVGSNVREVFSLFIEYTKFGVLPGAGGLTDQPASLVNAFGVCRAEKARCDADAEERRRKQERIDALAQKRGEFESNKRRR